jgi:hypothetical protein
LNSKVLSQHKLFLKAHPEVLMQHFLAGTQAINALTGKERTLDWHVLLALLKLKGSVSFGALYKVFNAGNCGTNNQRYYDALYRLVEKKQVKQQYSSKGWRLWSITPAGRQAITRLNEAALKYIPD